MVFGIELSAPYLHVMGADGIRFVVTQRCGLLRETLEGDDYQVAMMTMLLVGWLG